MTSRRTSSTDSPMHPVSLLPVAGHDVRSHTRSHRAAAVHHLLRVTPQSSRTLSDVGSRAFPRGLASPALPGASFFFGFDLTDNVLETAHNLLLVNTDATSTSYCDASVLMSPPPRCPHTGFCSDFTVARTASAPRQELSSALPRPQPERNETPLPAH